MNRIFEYRMYQIGYLLSWISYHCDWFMNLLLSYVQNRTAQIFKEQSSNVVEANLFTMNTPEDPYTRRSILYDIIVNEKYMNRSEVIESYKKLCMVIVNSVKEFSDMLLNLKAMWIVYKDLCKLPVSKIHSVVFDNHLANTKYLTMTQQGLTVPDNMAHYIYNNVIGDTVYKDYYYECKNKFFSALYNYTVTRIGQRTVYDYIAKDSFFTSTNPTDLNGTSATILQRSIYNMILIMLGKSITAEDVSIFVPIDNKNNTYMNFINNREDVVLVHPYKPINPTALLPNNYISVASSNSQHIHIPRTKVESLDPFKVSMDIHYNKVSVPLKKIDTVVKNGDSYNFFQLYQLLGNNMATSMIKSKYHDSIICHKDDMIELDDYHIMTKQPITFVQVDLEEKRSDLMSYTYDISHASLLNLLIEEVKELAPTIIDNFEKYIDVPDITYRDSLEDMAAEINYYYDTECNVQSIDLSEKRYHELDKVFKFEDIAKLNPFYSDGRR